MLDEVDCSEVAGCSDDVFPCFDDFCHGVGECADLCGVSGLVDCGDSGVACYHCSVFVGESYDGCHRARVMMVAPMVLRVAQMRTVFANRRVVSSFWLGKFDIF